MAELDGIEADNKGKLATEGPVAFCDAVVAALKELKCGYGKKYGAEQAVRSACSMLFPSTVESPSHPLSSMLFEEASKHQPNMNKHREKIVQVLGPSVTMEGVGDAYGGVCGWTVVCLCCLLKDLPLLELRRPGNLDILVEIASEFHSETKIHASPKVYKSWLAAATLARRKGEQWIRPWREYLPSSFARGGVEYI